MRCIVPFEPQPTLRGELVELRPLRTDDFAELYAVASDPLIWEQHPASDRYEESVFRAFFEEGLNGGGAFTVRDARSHQVIGSSRYYGWDEAMSEVEIGWTFLARSHWGGRYNGEMKRLMLQHAFQFVRSVIFRIGLNNIRSQRAIERIGAVRLGISPDTRGHASYLYRIVNG
jgi:RimJ/RimL family protein N-acetyltransferase